VVIDRKLPHHTSNTRDGSKSNIEAQVQMHVGAVPGVDGVSVGFTHMDEQQRAALRSQLRGGRSEGERTIAVEERTRVIAVASGKGGVGKSSLTVNLALALAPEVRVNAVAPGQVATRWFRRPFGEQAADDLEQKRADSTPLRGVAKPEHVAQAIMGLLGADFVTGQTLVVDGGASINY